MSEVADAIGEGVALAAPNFARIAEQRVGHGEASDAAEEERVAVHGVGRVGVELAVLILAADLDRVLARDLVRLPRHCQMLSPCTPPPRAGML